jgi:transcriptional regulator with XRE-family HTH domain
MKTGSIIKVLRTLEGMRQGLLAQRLGVSRSYLSQLENNKKEPSLSLLKVVSREFKMPIALLIHEEDDENDEVAGRLRGLFHEILSARMGASRKGREENRG